MTTSEPLGPKDLQPWHPRSTDVMRRLGRNMLLFQLIEAYVKAFVPYGHPDGARKSNEDLTRLRRAISDKSLGPALQLFKESIAHDSDLEASAFDQYTRRVVEARNTMTHGLLFMPGCSLQTEEGCQVVISLLDEHLRLLQPLLVLVSSNATILGVALGAVDEDAARALIAAMGGNLEIREYDPSLGLPWT